MTADQGGRNDQNANKWHEALYFCEPHLRRLAFHNIPPELISVMCGTLPQDKITLQSTNKQIEIMKRKKERN